MENAYNYGQLSRLVAMPSGWYVAIDCEMVGTGPNGSQSALARVSMVDWDGSTIMDSFVKVPVPVTDFRTDVSGITQEDLLSDNAHDLEEVRCVVQTQTILRGRILIGHGLDNDLSALMISHPPHCIRDTARYIPYMRVNKPTSKEEELLNGKKLGPRKLKDLVKERLGYCIQEEGHAHSSLEDARAALELYKIARPEWESLVSRAYIEECRKSKKCNKNAKRGRRQITPLSKTDEFTFQGRPQVHHQNIYLPIKSFTYENREPSSGQISYNY